MDHFQISLIRGLLPLLVLILLAPYLSKWMRSAKEQRKIEDIRKKARTEPYIFKPGPMPFIFLGAFILILFAVIYSSYPTDFGGIFISAFFIVIFLYLAFSIPRIEVHKDFLIIKKAILGKILSKKFLFDQIMEVQKKALGPQNPFPVVIAGKDFRQKIYMQFYNSEYGLALYEILLEKTKR